ncbi:MAG: DNA-binding domain-containing protein [Nitratireductor sp.]
MTGLGAQPGFAGSFCAALLDPDVAVPDGIRGPDQGDAPKRFSVYRNNVVVGLMEAMRNTFPSLRAIMGDTNFDRVARNFVAYHPPVSAMMQQYGAEFAEFLASFPPLAKSPFLADLARAERAYVDAWHERDAEPASIALLSGVPEAELPTLTFARHPASTVICSKWPVADLFDRRYGPPGGEIDLGQAQNLLITRPHFTVLVNQVKLCEAEFIQALFDGAQLGEAAARGFGADPEFDFGAALAAGFSSGALLAVI